MKIKIQLIVILLFLVSCANHNRVVTRKTTRQVTAPVVSMEDSDTIRKSSDLQVAHLSFGENNQYRNALKELENMLNGSEPLSFKRAVFLCENAWYNDSLDYFKFNEIIKAHAGICGAWMTSNKLSNYAYGDSLSMLKNGAIFTLMNDTIYTTKKNILHLPYQYNFTDFLAQENWSNQFVTTLLISGKGNCHSLPYLYKILADELETDAYLSVAPNHLYIKRYSDEWGWYNTELTSGEFPEDAWIKASGYVTIDAIRNGLYMDTLSSRQSIALCVFDLAKGYLEKTGNYMDNFVLDCCDIVLEHHPANINAMILKAETLKKQLVRFEQYGKSGEMENKYLQMQQYYVEGLRLGYREMPIEMYQSWLVSIREQKDKYINKEIKSIFKTDEDE